MLIHKESGQILLTVVLVMIVALTVGLSLASRSIVDIRTSTEEADSQRALVAAESGIEQALDEVGGTFSGEFSEIGSAYDVQITPVAGEAFLLNNGNLVEKGEGVDIWFVDHDSDGVAQYGAASWSGDNWLEIYWGTSETPCDNAALEVIIIVDIAGTPSLKRYAVDPCESRRTGGNEFDTAVPETYSIGGETLQHKLSIDPIASSSIVLFIRVVPIYTNAIMGVRASSALPTQGYSINSTGEFQAVDRQVKRSISVFKQYGQLPIEYLNYGLFSPCTDLDNPDC